MCRVLGLLFAAFTMGCVPPTSSIPDEPNPAVPTPCEEQSLAVLQWEQDTALESSFLYVVPPEPRALVLMFHGGGGSMIDNVEKTDPARIASEALDRGMAVASLNSYAHLDPDAKGSQWEEGPPGENNDLDNVEEMVRKLTSPTELALVPEGTPLVLLGISNGGSMASRAAQLGGLDTAAAAIYISNAVGFWEEEATFPAMVLVPGANDPGQALESNTELANQIGDPSKALLVVNPAEVVTDEFLTRVVGIDCELGEDVVLALTSSGHLDDDGMLTTNPGEDLSWRNVLPEAASPYGLALKDVLVEAYAGHAPSSDQNEVVFEFLEQSL